MRTSDSRVNSYLAQLRSALTNMTVGEREDIVEEIQMHIRERCGDGRTGVDEVLADLGSAPELAQQYRAGLLVQQAQRSISPLTILRATLRWARTGAQGTAVCLLAFLGYLTGACFLLLAVLKPIFPHYTGLWIGPGIFDFSFRMGLGPEYPSATVHEVLGWWFIPVCLVLGSLTILATTKLVQLLMKRFHWRVPFAHLVHGHATVLAG